MTLTLVKIIRTSKVQGRVHFFKKGLEGEYFCVNIRNNKRRAKKHCAAQCKYCRNKRDYPKVAPHRARTELRKKVAARIGKRPHMVRGGKKDVFSCRRYQVQLSSDECQDVELRD